MIGKIITVHNAGFERRKQWPALFEFNTWRETELYKKAISPNVGRTDSVLDVGCLTGHYLQVLREDGRNGRFTGIDFCEESIRWAMEHCFGDIDFLCAEFPQNITGMWNVVLATDVLEHVSNQGVFLDGVLRCITQHNGKAVVSVPKGVHYRDEGHINFYPDLAALENLLHYWFKIEQSFEIDDGQRLVCICKAGAV